MRSGLSFFSRLISSRCPSSSLVTLNRSPPGRQATSRRAFDTSIPTLLILFSVVLSDGGAALPCDASSFSALAGVRALPTSSVQRPLLPYGLRDPEASRSVARRNFPLLTPSSTTPEVFSLPPDPPPFDDGLPFLERRRVIQGIPHPPSDGEARASTAAERGAQASVPRVAAPQPLKNPATCHVVVTTYAEGPATVVSARRLVHRLFAAEERLLRD